MIAKPGHLRLLVAAAAAPLLLAGCALSPQGSASQGSASRPAAARAQTASAPRPASPIPALLPGLDLYSSSDRYIGTIQRVVQRDGKDYAVVAQGRSFFGFSPGPTVTVPVSRIHVDGEKLALSGSL